MQIMSISVESRFRGCLAGLAAGDAVGTTLEFRRKGSFEPITDMVGGGPFSLDAGQWTDDTSMALCLADSLIACETFNAKDQMDRYVRWASEGYLSSNGRCFDIGNTVSSALRHYMDLGNPNAGDDHQFSAGNGSIMRLAPIPMFYCYLDAELSEAAVASSITTHAAVECIDACVLLSHMIVRALRGESREAVFAPVEAVSPYSPKIELVNAGAYKNKAETEIKGSGYVVESLEAALWSVWTTTSYRDAVLAAANLGDDADTTAAIAGQLAGALYGYDAIPEQWRYKLAMGELIIGLADQLFKLAQRPS